MTMIITERNKLDAKTFREIRLESGVSQRKFADACHISKIDIWRYEKGKKPIPADVAERVIATAVYNGVAVLEVKKGLLQRIRSIFK